MLQPPSKPLPTIQFSKNLVTGDTKTAHYTARYTLGKKDMPYQETTITIESMQIKEKMHDKPLSKELIAQSNAFIRTLQRAESIQAGHYLSIYCKDYGYLFFEKSD